MFLKRLDTVGFKSFAERIAVDFVPGVTAVVGPNGSGKSNITDAIRWVLGEQSAKSLRGSKMEDIIFQGSDTRKPLNMAEVTLTLDNSDQALPLDYEEVSVTRRVYRSGESEFLINKQPCRLKDIVDLFMDSGLGREAFSIISQGKVEEILSSKAEERRSIFEEAAGVLKYKNRKKKAEYKLAETQENLNRVEDILYEIENQLEPLKEQAAVAKEYLEKKDQLKVEEITLLVAEIEDLHRQWTTVLAELEEYKAEDSAQKTMIQHKQASLEEKRTQVQALDESVEELQETLLVLTKELEGLQGKKQLLSERFKNFEQNKAKLELESNQLTARVNKVSSELREEQKKLVNYEKKRKDTKKNGKQVAAQLAAMNENVEEQIEELKSEYIELLNEQAVKRNEKQSIEKQAGQLDAKKVIQQEKFHDLISERKKTENKLFALNEELIQYQSERKEAEQSFNQLKAKLEREKQNYQDSQTKLFQGYQHIEKLKSKREMLEEMKEGFQGFFHGVKEVLQAREKQELSHIEGAVLELIDVPSEVVTAIETALGGQAQHIIVKDESAARAAINWLKRMNKGRATFLPLSAMKSKSISNDLLDIVKHHKGFVGVGSDLVSFPDRYRAAIQHLLGNVVVAEDLKAANEIAVKLHRRFRVVTLEGDVVNPGGSMTGGAQKKTSSSLFTREKDLQEVSVKLADFEGKAVAFEQSVKQQQKEIKGYEGKLEEYRALISNAQQKEQAVQAKLKEAELNVAHYNENLKMYDQDHSLYEQDITSMKEREAALTEELKELEQSLTHIQTTIDQLSQRHADDKQSKEHLQEKRQQIQVTLAEQEALVNNQREKTASLSSLLEDLQQSLEDKQSQLAEMEDFYHNVESEEEIERKWQEKEQQKTKVTTLIQSRKQQRLEQIQKINDQDREIKELNRLYQSLLVSLQEQEVKANRLDVELESRLNHLQSEYTLSYEKAKKTYDRAEDVGEAKKKVKLIKRSIEELGTVNVGAIEEYDRIEERYRFLSEQHEDLVSAKETLFGVISEMDEEMIRRFESSFNQIKQEFTIVFQALFGGGYAELKLTDPDDLLSTGVEIAARPPGKKLQQLGLLSGGERALTAIALLFAILRVRPVPFCVLDEVEAALDEANVNRFASYLKQFSEKTQFIVITHRKGTMEEADVLYGVTMQESGVSRLVSVRLEETPELVKF